MSAFFTAFVSTLIFISGWTSLAVVLGGAGVLFGATFLLLLGLEFSSTSKVEEKFPKSLIALSLIIGVMIAGLAIMSKAALPLAGIFGGAAAWLVFAIIYAGEHFRGPSNTRNVLLSIFVMALFLGLSFTPALPFILGVISPPAGSMLTTVALSVGSLPLLISAALTVPICILLGYVLISQRYTKQSDSLKNEAEEEPVAEHTTVTEKPPEAKPSPHPENQAGITYDFEKQNLAEYPATNHSDNHSKPSDLIIGDLHGNFLKLIYFLVQKGALSLDGDEKEAQNTYDELVKIHENLVEYGNALEFLKDTKRILNFFQSLLDKEKRDASITEEGFGYLKTQLAHYLRLYPSTLFSEELDQLMTKGKIPAPALLKQKIVNAKKELKKNEKFGTLEAIQGKRTEALQRLNSILQASTLHPERVGEVVLVGDIVADRCGDDEATVLTLLRLNGKTEPKADELPSDEKADSEVNKIPYTLLGANHDLLFIKMYEKLTKEGVLENDRLMFLNYQGISLANMYSPHVFEQNGRHGLDKKWFEQIQVDIQKAYKNHLKLLSYELYDDDDEAKQKILIITHAPIAFETYPYLAERMGVEYKGAPPRALAETIDRINQAFQENYVQQNKVSELFGMHLLLLKLYPGNDFSKVPQIPAGCEFEKLEIQRIAKWAGVENSFDWSSDENIPAAMLAINRRLNDSSVLTGTNFKTLAEYWEHQFNVAIAPDVLVWNRLEYREGDVAIPLNTHINYNGQDISNQYCFVHGHTKGNNSLDTFLGKSLGAGMQGESGICEVDKTLFVNPNDRQQQRVRYEQLFKGRPPNPSDLPRSQSFSEGLRHTIFPPPPAKAKQASNTPQASNKTPLARGRSNSV